MQTKNIIFCFTGTGNSLYLAKEIAKQLQDCEVILVDKDTNYSVTKKYERIGFVYPTYFQGIPVSMQKLIDRVDFSRAKDSYFFAIATYGAMAGNGLKMIKKELAKQAIPLHYGQELLMYENYILWYSMTNDIEEKTKQANINMQPMIKDIANKAINTIKNPNIILEKYYRWTLRKIARPARKFEVNNACISCGICEKLCPSKNIVMKELKPVFSLECEQCMACIQLCPKNAINYKGKTESRGRYCHPEISVSELIKNK